MHVKMNEKLLEFWLLVFVNENQKQIEIGNRNKNKNKQMWPNQT